MAVDITQKDVALYALQKLHVSKAVIADFETNDSLYLFDGRHFERLSPDSAVYGMCRSIESKYGIMVYAVTHELSNIGVTYSFLCVSKYEEDFKHMFRESRDKSGICTAYAYVMNMSFPLCSEFGYVALIGCYGSIRRIG